MTLVEFLHPLKKVPQRDQVLAFLYYLRRYQNRPHATTADIKDGFKKAKHTRMAKVNHAAVLNQAAPYVESPGAKENGRLLWSLTDTGEKRVRELLDLPTAEPELEHDVGTLEVLSARIDDEQIRTYVQEGVKCLQVGALRASVVFLWTGAVATLREKVWSSGARAIDAAVKVHNPRAPDFKKKDDFAYVRDATLLQIAQDLSVIDKTEKQRLAEALDLRNGCGHPTKYSPGVKKVSGFIEDVAGIVF